jgi:uncharacterized protein YndB with AHSA1/START domain
LGPRDHLGAAAALRNGVADQREQEPDPSRASEVEIRFTPQPDGTTRVDLEHRNFARMGESGTNMRMMVDTPTGWSGLLRLYAGYVEKGEAQ